MAIIKQILTTKYSVMSLILFLSVLCLSPLLYAEKSKDPNWVSIINLVAVPEKFDGELIYVSGWLYVGLEDNSLCLMRDPPSSKECLWLNFSDSPKGSSFGALSAEQQKKMLSKYKGKVVAIHGTFDSSDTGHMGGWAGGIHQITDIYTD